MLFAAFAALMPLPAALLLSGPSGIECPDAEQVRAALVDLGVDLSQRSGVAEWRSVDGHVRLRTRRGAATSSAAFMERDLEASACDELVQIVALSIERATAPIGETALKIEPVVPEAGYGFEIRGGFLALRSARTQYGGEAGLEVAAPWSGPLTGTLVFQGVVPVSLDVPSAALDAQRFAMAAGIGLRFTISSFLAVGGSAAFLVDYLHLRPTDSRVFNPIGIQTAIREGLRSTAWIAVLVGPFELRLEPAIRALQGVTFHAIPAQGDLKFPSVEAELGLAAGWSHDFF